MRQHTLHLQDLSAYRRHLEEAECASATVAKYWRDLGRFYRFCGGAEVDKSLVIRYKAELLKAYKPASVNSMLAVINGFLAYKNWHECRVKPVKIQHSPYGDAGRELTRGEYERLLLTAKARHNERLYYVMQTLCATGIRVGELPYITVQSLKQRQAQVYNKGKNRVVFLPVALCTQLKAYCQARHITAGSVFVTRSGKPLDRSNIWSMMKALCQAAHVAEQKVFPHNLRHLFARTFYKLEKDIEHLASILGHSSVDTTRIYTRTSGNEHRRQLERLNLVL